MNLLLILIIICNIVAIVCNLTTMELLRETREILKRSEKHVSQVQMDTRALYQAIQRRR